MYCSGGVRRYVRRQSVHDIRHYDCGGKDPGVRDEGQVQGEFPDRASGRGYHDHLLLVITRDVNYRISEALEYNLWEVVPYLVVLIGALIGINVFLVLVSGIVISLIVGVASGNILLSEMFTVVGDGVTSMYDITVISIIVACNRVTGQRIWRDPVYSESD